MYKFTEWCRLSQRFAGVIALLLSASSAYAGSGEDITCDAAEDVYVFEGDALYFQNEDQNRRKLAFKVLSEKTVATTEDVCINKAGKQFRTLR